MKKHFPLFLFGSLIFIGLYLSSRYNYLLFHNLAEIFSILIAFGIFMIAWNSRQFMENAYFLFIGIAYLFIGGLDLVHTFSYKGMEIFSGYGTNLPTQLWIAARYVQGFTLLLAPLFLRRKLKSRLIFLAYGAVFTLLLLSIFRWEIFPGCFLEGVGLTPFKKISEYIISGLLSGAIVLLLRKREHFDPSVFRWVTGSIVLTIASELSFTFYIDVYGISNLIGHYLKILSFYCIYKAIIETGLRKPYAVLFRDLKQSEDRYRSLFSNMTNGFSRHRVLYDEAGRPADYVFLDANYAFERLTGLKREAILNRKATEILPGNENEKDLNEWIGIFGKVAMTGNPARFETYAGGLEKWYSVIAYSTEKDHFTTVFEDITERRRMEELMRQQTIKLQQLNATLEQKVQERTEELTKARQRLRYLASQLLIAQEQERKRVAVELHDGLLSQLSATKYLLESKLIRLEEGKLSDPNEFKRVSDILTNVMKEARRIMNNLHPSVLDELGLISAINWWSEEYEKSYPHIKVQRQLEVSDRDISDGVRAVIFRVLQEALNNFAKHGKGDRVDLSLSKTNSTFGLMIRDNGQGFDVENAARGLGLESMRERVEISGGKFILESVRGVGTTIRASWTVAEKP